MSVRSNTEDFIKKARLVHGDRFEYTKVNYKTSSIRVVIICKDHGDFLQKPSEHLRSVGCLHCSNLAKTTKEDFLSEAERIHLGKYNYSLVEYHGVNKKVCIICQEHGEYMQSPKSHLKGYGCRFCGYIKRKQTKMKGKEYIFEKFIEDAKRVHKGRYDYSNVVFNGLNSDVEIVCREHGTFKMRPSNHLANQGCKSCSGITNWNTQMFILEAKRVHGDSYDYSKTNFVNVNTTVEIICNKHGSFFQKPLKHITRKDRCPKCSVNFKKTLSDVLSISKEVHKNKYEYLDFDFNNTNDYMRIVCPKHGEFKQLVVSHMGGRGCQACGFEVVDVFRRDSYVRNCYENYEGKARLYFIRCFDDKELFYKVGITCKDSLSKRFPKGVHMPYDFEGVLFLESTPDIVWDAEKEILSYFSGSSYKPKTVFGGSKTECFKFEDVESVKSKILDMFESHVKRLKN